MATTSIGAPGVTFPDATVQSSAGVSSVNGKGPGVVQSVVIAKTAITTTSGGNIDFTSLPSWVKRITIMFHNVSMSATNNVQVQLGTGSTTYTISGYGSIFSILGSSSVGTATASSGFVVAQPSTAAGVFSGNVVISNLTANTWTEVGNLGETSGTRQTTSTGSIALGAVLTAVRITSVSTDTFDAGIINIMYE
jgi:hypothetical protein